MQSRREFLRCCAGLGGALLLGGAAPSSPAVRAAVAWLAARQSSDGAWRSDRYAAFRDGDALTPVVLWALPPSLATRSAMAWLEALTDRPRPLAYPLFTASYAAQVFARSGDVRRAAVWADVVESLRISPALGWPADSAACGAWSDAAEPPRYLDPLPDMLAPNLSATLLGIQAMTAIGRDPRAALPFIERCQNFADGDGGFFFAEDDPIRNKAGAAGTDANGRTRFRSYGAATCDGLLALRACGLGAGHPRVLAATAWLQRHAHGLDHSGDWPADRIAARESLLFYHAQALAAVLALPEMNAEWTSSVRSALTDDLLARQATDGSWCGEAPASCEDDPLLATAFGIRALAMSISGS